MNNGKSKVDWFGFGIHFFFGAVFGAAIGLYLWARSDWAMSSSTTPGVLFVSGGAVLGGAFAGCRQDAFWTGVGDTYRELPWLWLKVLGIAAVVTGVIWLLFAMIK